MKLFNYVASPQVSRLTRHLMSFYYNRNEKEILNFLTSRVALLSSASWRAGWSILWIHRILPRSTSWLAVRPCSHSGPIPSGPSCQSITNLWTVMVWRYDSFSCYIYNSSDWFILVKKFPLIFLFQFKALRFVVRIWLSWYGSPNLWINLLYVENYCVGFK